jgi:predicted metal-dependent hydrolase
MEPGEREAILRAAFELFDAGRYLAAHELFEELWEETEGGDSDFFKGLVQAAIALHHFQSGNLEGATKLYSGHRRCLASYLPHHAGLDVARFLAEMQVFLRPVVERRPGTTVPFEAEHRPRARRLREGEVGAGEA